MIDYDTLRLYEKLDYPSKTITTAEHSPGLMFIYDEINNSGKTRAKNYVLDHMFNKRALCYSTTYIEGDVPALASVAWLRPMYNNIVRLCTRYCINPSLSNKNFGKGTDGMRIDTMDHIVQQMEFCQKLGYDSFFIGREDKSNGRRSKKIAVKLSEYTGTQWHCSDNKLLVAPNPSATDCWQYVIYNKRKDFDYEDIPV